MANEATITAQLRIDKNNVKYNSPNSTFQGDVTGKDGPVPGAISVTTSGTDISFSELTTPGYVEFRSLEDDGGNFVEFGIWDGATFHELGELLPGENYILRLSRNMTGLRFKADTAAVNVFIGAFET